MENPKISVVMSVYNSEKYIKEAVGSILAQTFSDFEFIIIDDGSSDGSLGILQSYEKKDSRIRIISRENKGLIYSLNEGVGQARGEYIARMDSDDISLPDRFEKQFRFMVDNDLALCGTWATSIDENGNDISGINYPPVAEKIKSFAILHNPFIHPSVMFRKGIFDKVGGYRNNFKHIEDYELWTRIIFKYKSSNLAEYLLKYRVHSEQVTKKNNIAMRFGGVIVRILAVFRYVLRF